MFLLLYCAAYGLCCLSTTIWFLLSYYDAFLCEGDLNGKAQTSSHMYSSHHRIIKCVGFKPVHCAII